MNRLLGDNGRVLAFGAHPDDLEVGAGGLLARLVREGAEVTLAVVSIPNQLEQRRAEAQAGADVIGGKLRVLFDERPTRVEDIPMHELVRRFDMVVGDSRPDLVITHSTHDLHWDHGLVNRATVSALRRTPCDLLAFLSSPEMNAQSRAMGQCFADITHTLELKIRAIQAHTSQVPKLDLESSRDLARAMGRISGYEYAEAYEALRVRV
ncbi:MAG: PIG-L family deacetylase [Deltaproteobacteria bacterium]|nr:PIG-L family deacetylase [Deltaproteobacteria bacterium]MCW5809052.1 PIG-L family deacetylase [Deltaproteobacteria bacterium]